MKKFIAAFDGLKFGQSTLEFAVYFSKQAGAHLVGVFLDDFMRHSYSIADITHYEGSDFDAHMRDLNSKDRVDRDESVALFERTCQEAGVNYSIHRDKNVAILELLHESVYADALIIGSGETLTRYEETRPTRFVRELLNEVQCPVLLVPDQYQPVEKITLLYDGEPSSVYAVRMFSYLFEPLKELETQVLTVKSKEQSLHLPDGRLIKEFVRRHYPEAEYVVVKGEPEGEIVRYLQREKKYSLVVLGAYRRGKLSRLFRPGMADHLVQHLGIPLFIAHNRP